MTIKQEMVKEYIFRSTTKSTDKKVRATKGVKNILVTDLGQKQTYNLFANYLKTRVEEINRFVTESVLFLIFFVNERQEETAAQK